MRDRVRLAFALIGPLILLLTFGYGITFDVENLSFAVLDRDQSADSRQLIESFAGSRYFREQAAAAQRSGDRPPAARGRAAPGDQHPARLRPRSAARARPEVGFFLDGAKPFRAETTRNYVAGHRAVLRARTWRAGRYGEVPNLVPVHGRAALPLQSGFPQRVRDHARPDHDLPGHVLGHADGARRRARARDRLDQQSLRLAGVVGEFLIGKQAPYVLVGFASFLSLVALAGFVFGVPVKGSAAALCSAALLYVFAATALGILISIFVRTQVAAIVATAIISTVPAINFSGYLYPAAALEGSGR